MGFIMPKVPAMPAIPPVQPLPEPPKFNDEDRAADTAAKRAKLRAARTGRSATILTGADGLEDDSSVVSKKTLLGG
tara:strand:+ start:4239 stop:4466 length:228 start_codon:yes stop_codon:yes gene_type:complete